MATIVNKFDWPDRFVVGTVGQPGERTFYMQAREGEKIVSVAMEKEQSLVLAQKIDDVLDQLMADADTKYSIPARAPEGLSDSDPLDQPIEEEFRVGAMSLGWDPTTAQIVIEAFPITEAEEQADNPAEVEHEETMIVRIPVGSARAFAQRTRKVASAGRPVCPLCRQPMETDDHVCALPDELQ